ncbi:MAG TPA: SMP-30/gluconolactonase/LRE family protein [Bryobacteraceae bacterium]|nr:SMP-30/gluconolactonase/LRE family protein [Bryobacteraceae bacterium]
MVDLNVKVEKVAAGFAFTEGPVFSRLGYLLFSDIPAKRIMKWEKGSVSVFRENSNGANGLTFDHQGRLLACEANRVTRTEKDGSITVLAGGAQIQHPNDLVYAIDGSVYFSDLPAKIVYQVTRAGEVRPVARDCDRPNGVALAPNQQKLYVADSGQRNVRVYEVAGDGVLRNGKVFAELKSEAQGVPDGLKTDEEGNVWVAGPTGIWVFDRDGRHQGTIATPEVPSNCNWGEGFHGLYVTARTSVYRLHTKVNGTRTY